jgi:glycosyltransferase involved in cell wall biosynthesis
VVKNSFSLGQINEIARKPMTIGMLLNAPYPSDVRIKKETDALIGAGHKIHLICLRRTGEKTDEQIGLVNIHRIDAGKENLQLAFWDVVMSLTFVHPIFKKAIPTWIKRNNIEVLHVHDLPLVGTAMAIRKQIGTPIIADFHENYPDALRTWFTWKKNPIAQLKNRFFMNPERWAALEKRATLESDRVIAVVDEMKQRLIKDYSVQSEKVTVVSNTEDKSFLDQPVFDKIYSNYKDKFIITYSGNIGPHRGVDTVIEAMGFLKAYPEIIFVIVGSGSDAVMRFLNELCIKNGVEQSVIFLGRQPFEKFYSYMRFSDANIIPHKSNGHTDNTVPHKLFQAMMVGRPLIVSSCAPLKRIVHAANSGIVFEADNAKDLSEKILLLYQNKELQKELGENGMKATIQGTLNWEHEQKSLLGVYNVLELEKKSSSAK